MNNIDTEIADFLNRIKRNEPEGSPQILTPKLAEYLLKHHNHPRNRKISPAIVGSYANMMESGEWKLSGVIEFDKNGTLQNGQHRLSAVIRYNKPVTFMVSTGLEEDAIDVSDRNKPRSYVDIAKIQGHDWITSDHFATFNGMMSGVVGHTYKKGKKSDVKTSKCMNALKEGILFADQYKKRQGGIKDSGFRGAMLLAYYDDKRIDKDILSDFMLYFHGCNPLFEEDLFSDKWKEYNPKMVQRLREQFKSKNWKGYGLEGTQQIIQKFNLVQHQLHNYLIKAKVSKLTTSENLWFSSKFIKSLILDWI